MYTTYWGDKGEILAQKLLLQCTEKQCKNALFVGLFSETKSPTNSTPEIVWKRRKMEMGWKNKSLILWGFHGFASICFDKKRSGRDSNFCFVSLYFAQFSSQKNLNPTNSTLILNVGHKKKWTLFLLIALKFTIKINKLKSFLGVIS